LNMCRDCIVSAITSTPVALMGMTAVSGARPDANTTNTSPASAQAEFEAVWDVGTAIDDITQFQLKDSAANIYATINVTAFDVAEGQSLKVTWTTTLS